MLDKFFWFLTRLSCLATLITYAFGYWLKPIHWSLGFITLSIQILLYVCFAWVIFWLFKSKIRAFYPLAVLLLGFPFLQRMVSFHPPKPLGSKKDLRVLNYNVEAFKSDLYYAKSGPEKTIKAVSFAADFNADVKCFQDFYNWDETRITRSIQQITKKDTPYYVTMKNGKGDLKNQGRIGIVTFAKYPLKYIYHKEFEVQGNGILVADMKMGSKTIRIINVQLHSMGLRVNKVLKNDIEKVKAESRNILSILKRGFAARNPQVVLLEKWIINSPHTVLLCGDFNEVPYGFAYGTAAKHLKNAFENAGYGFGNTLNRSPRFVRIDQQFYGKGLKINSFETLNDVENSDHYPIYGEYVFE